MLDDERGAHEAANDLARLLQEPAEHGEEWVREALEAGLAEGSFDERAIERSLAEAQQRAR